jgi:hypothetical protein
MESLIDRAHAVPSKTQRNGKPNPELAQLAIAWAAGEITLKQVAGALGRPGAGAMAYSPLAFGFRDAVALGLLVRPKR